MPRGAFADRADTVWATGCARLGVQTGIDFDDGVTLCVDARNLADARRVSDIAVVNDARTTAGDPAALAAFYPGNGRSVFAGIRAGVQRARGPHLTRAASAG